MPMFVTRFSYTPETWARLRQHPEDRSEAARESIEAAGGKLHGFWYALGEFDGITLWEAPSRVALASALVAIAAAGVTSKLETTVLLSVEEAMDAMKQSARVHHRAPGVTVGTPAAVA
jgi:uncharacterized protein with GYD domain